MASSDLIRAPTWVGLSPGLPRTVSLSAHDEALLLTRLRTEGRLQGLSLGLGSGAMKHFVLTRSGKPPEFVKIVAPQQREASERAEGIARWLKARGLPVTAPSPGWPRDLDGGSIAIATRYLNGRRVVSAEEDLGRLGEAVGKLHLLLARYPDRELWQTKTEQRLETLMQVRCDLANGAFAYGPRPDELVGLAADDGLDFVMAGMARTPLHGDFNPGNVLVDIETGKIVIFDFEDVFHSVLSPLFELLLIIERFILVPVADDVLATRYAKLFADAYAREVGGLPSPGSFRPSDVLRSLSLRSLCVLSLGEKSGTLIGRDEWDKFFRLERQAKARAAILNQTFRGVGA